MAIMAIVFNIDFIFQDFLSRRLILGAPFCDSCPCTKNVWDDYFLKISGLPDLSGKVFSITFKYS